MYFYKAGNALVTPPRVTTAVTFGGLHFPDLHLDGNSGLSHNGSAKDLAAVMENLKKNSLVSRQNQSLNTQVTSSTQQKIIAKEINRCHPNGRSAHSRRRRCCYGALPSHSPKPGSPTRARVPTETGRRSSKPEPFGREFKARRQIIRRLRLPPLLHPATPTRLNHPLRDGLPPPAKIYRAGPQRVATLKLWDPNTSRVKVPAKYAVNAFSKYTFISGSPLCRSPGSRAPAAPSRVTPVLTKHH
ncbi:hypothetical protein EVAR_39060_1 [Eumeta japonica]|uniref:Uncharacterized protein n=1 Tax=Eumeta variegata TaxID=151549 RepID=A0A4C1WR09_EUMVA|nr:hypothetical protein EVAR_39060_1 [Eumeta japonica]